MALSRKHFFEIARLLKEFHRRDLEHTSAQELLDELTSELINWLKSQNSLFDTHRFINAIEYYKPR